MIFFDFKTHLIPFPHYNQSESKDCGATCLKIIAKFYGKLIRLQELREISETTRMGSSLLLLCDAAEKIGFRSLGVKVNLKKLEEVPLPCILYWNQNHFVVLYEISKKRKIFRQGNKIYKISDPGFGLITYNQEEFIKFWTGKGTSNIADKGVALILEPTANFLSDNHIEVKNKFGFGSLFKYIKNYKSLLFQLSIGLLAGSLLQLLTPFLTQSVVDIGIKSQNINFVTLILWTQIFFFASSTGLDIIRNWIVLHLSVRINIALISDFFIKLMNLPISFFDTRLTGDIMQRISDHQRIERILTTSSLSVLFSLFNMLIMGSVLVYYNLSIFTIYFTGSFFYFLWILFFLKQRETLDYKRFSEVSQEQSKVIELINGMQEIKLHNAEKQKRWGWENIQARLFKVTINSLILNQIQSIGASIINQFKNILILFFTAKLVIEGTITFGMMLAIITIIGGLDGPLSNIIGFIYEIQDAKISLARLSEIHEKEDEIQNDAELLHEIPENSAITLKEVSFRYIGSDINVLENLNLTIPANKITAIVGTSGSGKTTLMKLLLKFYEPNSGEIGLIPISDEIPPNLGMTNLRHISPKTWRNHVGTVMQEGYIFNDTIANNIAIGVDVIDKKRLEYAADVANIKTFIQEYPLRYNTKIGMEGVGISTGQKQRLLIARAVYKNPEILFFDEATSALDANNEKEIMEKLNVFFKNKTVIVIAHRLSTVINADQIVVLEKGKIVEVGTHKELVTKKGNYFELVRNQLQLGN